jgi:oxygen-independent coproporphyrinogen-3 oxidase
MPEVGLSPAVLGLYIHIPFCSAICSYCNFTRGLRDPALEAHYVDALTAEIARAGRGEPVDTIFFGGGTPSLLAPGDLARILAACRDAFAVARDAEVTLEANPETVTAECLAAYRRSGINRLSIGVQSFDDGELERLGRIHSAQRAREAVADARRAGFDNISLDLMLWLPGQTMTSWLGTVEALLAVGPEHASLYLLELYPNAPLREAIARESWRTVSDDEAADMYLAALDRLDHAGFAQYEISNVARPGRESRHNLKYWTDGEWLGMGCGAHSTRDGVRWRTVSSTTEYIARVVTGQDLVAERRTLTRDERVEEALFTGLRLAAGIDLDAVGARYGVDVWERFGPRVEPLLASGRIVRSGARLRLTREGMLVANELMQVFV